jgi:hypothetical protein
MRGWVLAWFVGLVIWLLAWAKLWWIEPPSRFDWRAPVGMFFAGVLWPLVLFILIGAVTIEAHLDRSNEDGSDEDER